MFVNKNHDTILLQYTEVKNIDIQEIKKVLNHLIKNFWKGQIALT
jgi:hypothetical protein